MKGEVHLTRFLWEFLSSKEASVEGWLVEVADDGLFHNHNHNLSSSE